MKPIWIAKLSTLVLFPVLLTPVFAFGTATGNSTGGGGLAVGNTLLDLYEKSAESPKVTPFKPADLPEYRRFVAPALRELDAKVPFFAAAIRSGLTQKQWVFTGEALSRSNDECSIFALTTNQVARQDEERVAINEKWFNDEKTPAESKAALVLHEMVMHRYLQMHPGGCSKNVREMVRLILNVKDKTAEELVTAINHLGFGLYSTRAKLDTVIPKMAAIAKEFCEPFTLPPTAFNEFFHFLKFATVALDVHNDVGFYESSHRDPNSPLAVSESINSYIGNKSNGYLSHEQDLAARAKICQQTQAWLSRATGAAAETER